MLRCSNALVTANIAQRGNALSHMKSTFQRVGKRLGIGNFERVFNGVIALLCSRF